MGASWTAIAKSNASCCLGSSGGSSGRNGCMTVFFAYYSATVDHLFHFGYTLHDAIRS